MPIIAEMHIQLDDKGALSVNGPLAQTLLCYGLLEMAKDTVRRHNEEKRVAPAGMRDLVSLTGGRQS